MTASTVHPRSLPGSAELRVTQRARGMRVPTSLYLALPGQLRLTGSNSGLSATIKGLASSPLFRSLPSAHFNCLRLLECDDLWRPTGALGTWKIPASLSRCSYKRMKKVA